MVQDENGKLGIMSTQMKFLIVTDQKWPARRMFDRTAPHFGWTLSVDWLLFLALLLILVSKTIAIIFFSRKYLYLTSWFSSYIGLKIIGSKQRLFHLRYRSIFYVCYCNLFSQEFNFATNFHDLKGKWATSKFNFAPYESRSERFYYSPVHYILFTTQSCCRGDSRI